jgi:hypothetical protein
MVRVLKTQSVQAIGYIIFSCEIRGYFNKNILGKCSKIKTFSLFYDIIIVIKIRRWEGYDE